MKFSRYLFGIFQVALIVGLFTIFSIAIFQELSTPYNFIIATGSIILGFFIGIRVLQFVIQRGNLEASTLAGTSPELDDLFYANGVKQHKFSPIEFSRVFPSSEYTNTCVKLNIWGDQNDRKLNIENRIKSVEFDQTKNQMIFIFDNESILVLVQPSVVLCSPTYIKIKDANEIHWEILTKQKEVHQFSYYNQGYKIHTDSNTNWKPKRFHLGLGKNALYMTVHNCS